MTDLVEHEQVEEAMDASATMTLREAWLRRIGFWVGLVIWILILMIPSCMFWLAISGEIKVSLPGDVPDNQLRIWTVMEPRERGIAYSLPRTHSRDDSTMSVQTTVRYLLWEGEAASVRYCQLYQRDGDDWESAGVSEGGCE